MNVKGIYQQSSPVSASNKLFLCTFRGVLVLGVMRFSVPIAVLLIAYAGPLILCAGAAGHKTFTSADGLFQFTYPASLPLFTQNVAENVRGFSYAPVCQEDALVCVAYPSTEFKYSNFEAAGFYVEEIPATSKHECLTSPDVAELDTGAPGYTYHLVFDIPPKDPVKVINGVNFEHGITGGAAAGHSTSEDVYRNFHDGKCYELTIAWTYTDAEADPPYVPLTPSQQQHIRDELNAMLSSFKFLR